MCGIVGFTGYCDEFNHLYEMNRAQHHRGPDDDGHYFCKENGVYLGAKRLSIVDITHGHQPMHTLDHKYSVVFNGEIFNAPQLRDDLESRQISFRTSHSDTEVLLHLYKLHGVEMVNLLNGMFAFVIYDKEKNLLFCARDPFGIKPLFYSTASDRFAFASEIKSLRRLPWIDQDLDPQAAYHYFSFQAIPSPYSAWRTIEKLPAAHYLEWHLDDRSINVNRYWTPRFSKVLPCSVSELPKYVESKLAAAVKRWSMSDVPIACALSGGIDSSAITAILSEHQSSPIKTFSLGFPSDPNIDERALARRTAEFFGTEHHELELDANNIIEALDPMLLALDEPYGGGLPSWYVFQQMAQTVKVGVTGTGGDELFGNYGKWIPYDSSKDFLRSLIRRFRLGSGLSAIVRYPLQVPYVPQYFYDREKQVSLFNTDFLASVAETSVEHLNKHWLADLSARDALTEIDFSHQLAEEFLFMTDRFSMAHSLEIRTPFLDKDLVESLLMIPAQYRSVRDDGKSLLKAAMRPILPPHALSAPKRGFVVPIAQWLTGVLLESFNYYLGNDFLNNQGIFDKKIQKRFSKLSPSSHPRLINQAWTWYMFQRWYDLT
jgi:asparagine synthase (glutamine-hydrolysing)